MKKLLLLFIPLVFFFGCEEEEPVDTSGYNCTPDGCFADNANAQYLTIEDCENYCNPDDYDDEDGESANWSFTITLNGNTYSASGGINCEMTTTSIMGETANAGWGGYYGGEMKISLIISDITEDSYISGGYIGLDVSLSNPFVGLNSVSLSPYNVFIMPNNDWSDYIYTMGAGSLYANTEGASNTNYSEEMATINVMITSLGGECGDGNIEGYYSGTLYTPSNPNSGIYWEYDVAVEVEFSFSVPRLSTY